MTTKKGLVFRYGKSTLKPKAYIYTSKIEQNLDSYHTAIEVLLAIRHCGDGYDGYHHLDYTHAARTNKRGSKYNFEPLLL